MRGSDYESLIRAAFSARKNAYAPYSSYTVGSALLCADGCVYTGCNVENAAYSVCNCAERTALFKAVSEGKRDFTAIAIVGGKADEPVPLRDFAFPCGVCRQALSEFAPRLLVVAASAPDHYMEYPLCDLLPYAFGSQNLFSR